MTPTQALHSLGMAAPLPTVSKPITRANVDSYLDSGSLYIQMKSRRWWKLRRNGATKRWKRDSLRLKVPVKYGMYGYGAITESGFYGEAYDPSDMRHSDDVPESLRAS